MEQNAPKRDIVSTLARVLGGGLALVMLGSALWHTTPLISLVGQTASTWIGDQIGAPEGYLGRTWPDDPSCFYVYGRTDIPFDTSRYCAAVRGWGGGQVAQPLYADDDYRVNYLWSTIGDFYSAVFSVSPADADPTGTYPTNTYDGTYDFRQLLYMGPGSTTEPYPDYKFSSCEAYTLPSQYEGLRFATVSSVEPFSFFFNSFYTAIKGATTSNANNAHCWVVAQIEDPPVMGRDPSTPGQTAFSISEYAPWIKIRNLGPEVCTTNPDNPEVPICAPPPLPADAQPGDTVMQMDPLTKNFFAISRDQSYWQMRPNTAPGGILHESGQRIVGDIPTVAPGENITLQWACQPSRNVQSVACSGVNNQIDNDCNEVTTGGFWRKDTLFTSSTGSASAGAPAFSTGTGSASLRNKKTIKAATEPGIYTYSLTCNGPDIYGKILSVKVKVGATCEPAPVVNGGFKLEHGKAYKLAKTNDGTVFNFCAFNTSTDTDYFVPVKTKAEFQSFVTSVKAGTLTDAAGKKVIESQ